MAAACLFFLCRNHSFADGNKRTALVFLEANGLLADPGVPAKAIDDWEALVLDVAASRLDREQATRRLRALLKG